MNDLRFALRSLAIIHAGIASGSPKTIPDLPTPVHSFIL